MSTNKKDEHITYFRGAKLKKREANQAGFGILFGIFGIVIFILIFGTDKKLMAPFWTVYSLDSVFIYLAVFFIKGQKKEKRT